MCGKSLGKTAPIRIRNLFVRHYHMVLDRRGQPVIIHKALQGIGDIADQCRPATIVDRRQPSCNRRCRSSEGKRSRLVVMRK